LEGEQHQLVSAEEHSFGFCFFPIPKNFFFIQFFYIKFFFDEKKLKEIIVGHISHFFGSDEMEGEGGPVLKLGKRSQQSVFDIEPNLALHEQLVEMGFDVEISARY
jgi:hypothetical protein